VTGGFGVLVVLGSDCVCTPKLRLEYSPPEGGEYVPRANAHPQSQELSPKLIPAPKNSPLQAHCPPKAQDVVVSCPSVHKMLKVSGLGNVLP
jgi:hypothetical protein